jgi:hypothetical protein
MFFTVPFSARFHYQPHDYWRFTPSSLEYLCSLHGFDVLSISPRGDALVVILNKLLVFFVATVTGIAQSNFLRIPSWLVGFVLAIVTLPLMDRFLIGLGLLFLLRDDPYISKA